MRRFLQHIVLFLTPLMMVTAGIISYPPDKRAHYDYLKEDCSGRGAWLYHRLFEHPQPADVVFIGTSRTMRAVNDSLLEHLLHENNLPMMVLNAGYCRIGRDLHAVIARDVLQQVIAPNGQKHLVIEIHEREGVASHPVFYRMGSSHDVVAPASLLNQQYFSNMYSAGLMRLDVIRAKLWQLPPDTLITIPSTRWGVFKTDHEAPAEDLNASQQRCSERPITPASAWNRFETTYSLAWLDQIVEQAKRKNCKVSFLYLPSYGCGDQAPRELLTYQQWGDVWLPPTTILSNPKNWSDRDHFNNRGAAELALWLNERLLCK